MITNIITGLWITIYDLIIITFFFSIKKLKLRQCIAIILFCFLYGINLTYANPFIQIILHLLLTISFCLYIIPHKKDEVIYLIGIIYFIRLIFEILLTFSLYILHITIPTINTLIIMTSILTIMFILTFKSYINNFISYKKMSHNKEIQNIIILNVYLILIIVIRIPNYFYLIKIENILSLLTAFIIFNICFILLEERAKYKNFINSYNHIVEYYNTTEDLLTKYKTNLHESKNQLIIIQSLAKDNKELYNYVSLILNEKENHEYNWINDIKNIPINGIKGLMNYKILKMKEVNIKTEIFVSDNIKIADQNLSIEDKNDLYTIIGVLLDNAIEASLESIEKMIAINVYEENSKLIFLIANTFKNINLEHINEKGFSTKSKNRGMGLYLVTNIINKNYKFTKTTEVNNNFFIQKICYQIK